MDSPLTQTLTRQLTELDLSPSKARAAASESHAWSHVTIWLPSIFPSGNIPPFERNASILAYLQSLMHVNITADETRKLLHEARVEQLLCYGGYHNAMESRPERRLLAEIEQSLSPGGREALQSMAKASVKLGYVPQISKVDQAAFSIAVTQKLQQLTIQLFDLQNQVHDMNALKERFEKELTASRQAAEELETTLTGHDADAELERTRLQTVQYVRELKQISLKMGEYQDRIAALSRHVEAQQGTTAEDVKNKEAEVGRSREEVRRLEGSLKQFNGLPPSVEASRQEVRRAQTDLDRWKRKREEMFERM